MRWSNGQLAATVDQEIVILSVERGSYYGLDDIGSEIWQQMARLARCASMRSVRRSLRNTTPTAR